MCKLEHVAVGSLPLKMVFSYGGVDWVVLEHQTFGILCITKDSLYIDSFDYSSSHNWKYSSLRNLLNYYFLNSLISEGAFRDSFIPIMTSLTHSFNFYNTHCVDLISALSPQQYYKYRSSIPHLNSLWWLSTGYVFDSKHFLTSRFVTFDDALYGDDARFCLGVRPICFLYLNTLVSVFTD